jgi:aminomethyltransferase
VSVGTAFHSRTADLNVKQQWREWSGYLAASAYADHHQIEYNALRESAGLIDVSPLFKYRIAGPGSEALVDRLITRDAKKLTPGRVYYAPWCDEAGRVIDDGTIHRLDDGSFRWTAADPQYRWLHMNAGGLDVEIEDVSADWAAIALQGPRSRDVLEAAAGESFADLRYFRRRAATLGGIAVDVSRTGYTGDLGYEVWIPADRGADAWDALMTAGGIVTARPVGMLALDIARIEAGLLLIEVDYTSATHALIADQAYSPFELGLGRLVDFEKGDFVGRRALLEEQGRGGPERRLVGLRLDWNELAALYAAQGLPPQVPGAASRAAVPAYDGSGRRVGKVTSTTWSPILKQMIALASVPARFERPGSVLRVEWTVEAVRGTVGATVVALPFYDPARKRA